MKSTKPPRDFPNDILNEVENMYFSMPELGSSEKIGVEDASMKPILILSSNSEKHLPEAFLRISYCGETFRAIC